VRSREKARHARVPAAGARGHRRTGPAGRPYFRWQTRLGTAARLDLPRARGQGLPNPEGPGKIRLRREEIQRAGILEPQAQDF